MYDEFPEMQDDEYEGRECYGSKHQRDDDDHYESCRENDGDILDTALGELFESLVAKGTQYRYYKHNPDKFVEHAMVMLNFTAEQYKKQEVENEKANQAIQPEILCAGK